jgi:hypothetical protein
MQPLGGAESAQPMLTAIACAGFPVEFVTVAVTV